MAKEWTTKLTGRDMEILESLDRFPLTPSQLCKLSRTFGLPFADVHPVRRRLRKLASSGLIKAFPYAVASFGSSPAYYQLTRAGYRLLHGPDHPLPNRRYFDPIGQARHPHTWSLTDLLVHIFVCAKQTGAEIRHFARENSVAIKTGEITLRPDAGLQILIDGQAFNFVVELDNGSERVRSRVDVESIERKIRGYDAHTQSLAAYDSSRYVVLFITTRSVERQKHLMAAADALMQNSQRTLFLGGSLEELLLRSDMLRDCCFLTPQFTRTSMIPFTKVKPHQNPSTNFLTPLPAFC